MDKKYLIIGSIFLLVAVVAVVMSSKPVSAEECIGWEVPATLLTEAMSTEQCDGNPILSGTFQGWFIRETTITYGSTTCVVRQWVSPWGELGGIIENYCY